MKLFAVLVMLSLGRAAQEDFNYNFATSELFPDYAVDPETWNAVSRRRPEGADIQWYSSSLSNLVVTDQEVRLIPTLSENNTEADFTYEASSFWSSARLESVKTITFDAGKRTVINTTVTLGQPVFADGTTPWFGTMDAPRHRGIMSRVRLLNTLCVGDYDLFCGRLTMLQNEEYHWFVQVGAACGPSCYDKTFNSDLQALNNYNIYTMEVDRLDPDNEAITFYVNNANVYNITRASLNDDGAWSRLVGNTMTIVLDVAVRNDYNNDTLDGRDSMMSVYWMKGNVYDY